MTFALLLISPTAFAELPAELRSKVRVFTYEGEPAAIAVEQDAIVLDYQWSRVTVDRTTLAVKSRLTRAEGLQRNDTYGMRRPGGHAWRFDPVVLVGPGIVDTWFDYNEKKPTHVAAATVTNGGATWRAMQPADALNSKYRNPEWTSWTKILRRVGTTSYVERVAGGQTNRFTQVHGLAGNLVAHLAVAGGIVWAGCVDVYDLEKKTWTDGGLCFFDEQQGRWQEAPAIENCRIRFVTGLRTIGDALYVLHREGKSMTGDEIAYGMGLYPGDYRPVTTSIVLSRRDKNGKWTSWRRPPVLWEMARPWDTAAGTAAKLASTERAQSAAVDGPRLLVYSTVFDFASGNWKVERRGVVSVLNTTTGAWTAFDPLKDFSSDALAGMHAENGEILVTSNVGVHRWRHPAWELINTGAALKNAQISAVATVGDEVWVGYNKPGFGVFGTQGISRYNEKTGQWSWMSPEDLGTASPVREIVCVKEETYVLFAAREWLGSAMEWTFYAREAARKMPPGLGRFAGGKWEFPFTPEGIPATVPWYYSTRTDPMAIRQERVQVEHIAAASGKLLVGTTHGLFEGPAPFKRIREGRVPNIPGEDPPHRPAPWGGGQLALTVTPYADWLWHSGELIRVERAASAARHGGKP